MKHLVFGAAVAAIALTLGSERARADEAVLVLDASGSMWGKIEGKTKAEIAKGVVSDLLAQVPAERSLGLVAYGHRREGDCADIEEVAAVGADRAAIKSAVNALNFKGKTPLTAAVRFAAEKLRYKQQKATVILVTDGAETCKADPCALGAELEAAGVDFTAHVIGFGLENATEEAGLKCLAEATGGKYLSAKTGAGLAAALKQTAAAPKLAATQAARIVLRATELVGGPEIASGLSWTVKAQGGAQALEKSNVGSVAAEIPPGDYTVTVARADGLKGQGVLNARAGVERTLTIPLEFKLAATLASTPAGAAPAGSSASIKWTGPNRDGDYVTVVKVGAELTAYLDYDYTKAGDPLVIDMPVEPGDYEIRYMLGRPQRTLAALAIKVTAVAATLKGPSSVAAGAPFDIDWTGPNGANDWITVVKPDAPDTAYADYFYAKPENRSLKAPVEPGDYELRFVQDGKKVIARSPIKVAAVEAGLHGPPSGVAGQDVTLTISGPAQPGDWITVVKPDEAVGSYNDYFDAKSDDRSLMLPMTAGDYEFRYVQDGKKVIARAPIKVSAATASISGPAKVAKGAAFDISWKGPNYRGDWLTIVKPEQGPTEYGSYVDVNEASAGKLTAPAAPGQYELRYVIRGKAVIARKPIIVE